LVMRSDNHDGTRPPCKGKSANPDRFISDLFYSPRLKVYSRHLACQKEAHANKRQCAGFLHFSLGPGEALKHPKTS
jgi:hypothetical protein